MSAFFQRFLKGMGIGILAAVLAEALGLDLSGLQFLTGSLGVGLGFSLQIILADFVSALVLIVDPSVRMSDVISFTHQSGTKREGFGWLKDFRARVAVLEDRDGINLLIPYHRLVDDIVVNWSRSGGRVRLRLPVQISYESDPERALPILTRAASIHPRVLPQPAPLAYLKEFKPSGILLELQLWIADPQSGVNNVLSDLNADIEDRFDEAGVSVATTRRDWHITGDDAF
jgi:small-conductance mechanosensitive channel